MGKNDLQKKMENFYKEKWKQNTFAMESESESESQILSSQKMKSKLPQHEKWKQNIFIIESLIETFIAESEIDSSY